MPPTRLKVLKAATFLLCLAAAWSQPGPAPTGTANAPGPSTPVDCPVPDAGNFNPEADIPSQRAALDLLFEEASLQALWATRLLKKQFPGHSQDWSL